MKRIGYTTTLAFLALSTVAAGQSVDGLNERFQLAHDSLNDVYTFNWLGKAGRTYFIQYSLDLDEWRYFPEIESGIGEVCQVDVITPENRIFARLQYTDQPATDPEGDDFDGDGVGNLEEITMSPDQGDPLDASSRDGDTMPDDWERFFGLNPTVDDSAADPDEDGLTNLEESQLGTNPVDFYNGEAPLITILVGAQDVGMGEFSEWPFDALITDGQGAKLANAPVVFSVVGGYHGLTTEADPMATISASLTLRTNSVGRIHPAFTPIYLMGGPSEGALHSVLVTAGDAQASFEVTVTPALANSFSEPKQLERFENPSGGITYSWTGGPTTAETFQIEENRQGEWIRVYEVPVSALPAPDPLTGVYSVTIGL